MATYETPTEKLERLGAMAHDEGETWDLSDKDQAAIAWAYTSMDDWFRRARLPCDSPATEDATEARAMTLRDWLAGLAMQGWVQGSWHPDSEAELAERCYRMADAMLAARASEEAHGCVPYGCVPYCIPADETPGLCACGRRVFDLRVHPAPWAGAKPAGEDGR